MAPTVGFVKTLLEGSAVVNAVFMMIGDNLWHLIPIAIAVLAILINIPTMESVKSSMEAMSSSVSPRR